MQLGGGTPSDVMQACTDPFNRLVSFFLRCGSQEVLHIWEVLCYSQVLHSVHITCLIQDIELENLENHLMLHLGKIPILTNIFQGG